MNRHRKPPPVTIVGLGNPLLKDDGIGPRVVRELQRGGLPQGVQAVEAGGSLYQYWEALAESRHVIVVDAVRGGHPPGTVYLLSPSDIAQERAGGQEGAGGREDAEGLLRHEDDLLNALSLMAHFEVRPEVSIVGVEPKEIAYSLDLSPEISARLPEISEFIRGQCILLLRTGPEENTGHAVP
jgi:hydrogenase maturation protease